MGPNRRLRLGGGLPFSASMLEGLGRPIWGPTWGRLGPILGASGANMGPSWANVGASWAHLGVNLAPVGHLLTMWGVILGHAWSILPMMPTAGRYDDDYDCEYRCVSYDRDTYDDQCCHAGCDHYDDYEE